MKTIKVTNMAEMFTALNMNPNGVDTNINIDDIDDDVGELDLAISKAVTPELPQRNFNIRTLTQEKLEELKNTSK